MTDTTVFTSGGFTVKSLDDIKKAAPSVFTEGFDPQLSERVYCKISTINIIKVLKKFGWNPISARQVGTGPWGVHVIRFSNKESGIIQVKKDDVIAQLVLTNSYNGYSQVVLDQGIHRVACDNGMTVAIPGLTTNYSLRHVGIDEKLVKEIIEKSIVSFADIQKHIEQMQNFPLTDEQQLDFAVRALVSRDSHLYKDKKGKVIIKRVEELNKISELLEPMRDNDKGNDLWRVFNVIQEKLVLGGYKRISHGTGRSITVPGIGNPVRNVVLNKALWSLAEGYLLEASKVK